MYKFEKLGLNIWDDVFMNAKHLSEKARLLYCYLLTCPLSNIAGVYQITNERIAFDLDFSSRHVEEALRELRRAHKAFRVGSYIIIVDAPLYLKKRLKTVLRTFANIIEELPLKVKVKLHIYHYHWGDLESNIHTKKAAEKVKFLGEAYIKKGKDIKAIKQLEYEELQNAKDKKKDKNEEQGSLIDYDVPSIEAVDVEDNDLIEVNLCNFLNIARSVFNRNKPIISKGFIANSMQKASFFTCLKEPLLLPYYASETVINNELGGGDLGLSFEDDYDASYEVDDNDEIEEKVDASDIPKLKEPKLDEAMQPPPHMALPDLKEFAEEAKRYYINKAKRFLDKDVMEAYKRGREGRRQLRAIELFREKQYKEHRLEIIEKRLLNKDNPNYNVWKDYPIDWVEIKRMMEVSFDDVIIACNCDDADEPNSSENTSNKSKVVDVDTMQKVDVINTDIMQKVQTEVPVQDDKKGTQDVIQNDNVKNNDDGVENNAKTVMQNHNNCRNKIIMQNISPSKREEILAFAKAHILINDTNFDIKAYLKEKVEKIKAMEEAELAENNSSSDANSNSNSKRRKAKLGDYYTPILL